MEQIIDNSLIDRVEDGFAEADIDPRADIPTPEENAPGKDPESTDPQMTGKEAAFETPEAESKAESEEVGI